MLETSPTDDGTGRVATEFGRRLRAARKARDMTQNDVARLVGVREKDVGRWEGGAHMPHPSRLPLLAEVLEVSLDHLFALDD